MKKSTLILITIFLIIFLLLVLLFFDLTPTYTEWFSQNLLN